MSKRRCPFEDHCGPQRKQHVGTHDIEQREEDYRKSIYDKTLSLLFNGVNNNNRITPSNKNTKIKNPVSASRQCEDCNDVKCIQGSCSFCEVSLCIECIKSCTECSELFCSRCSVAIFRNESNYVCLNCYS